VNQAVFPSKEGLGVFFMEKEDSMTGSDSSTNLYSCVDGIYEVVCYNPHYDWETGCLDYYDFKLVRVD
jgi:hypothetical protein